MILTELEVRNYLYNSGFRGGDLNGAVAICFCESSFDTEAHNTSGEDSRGLMQINIDANPQYSHLNLFDPQINTDVAFEMYSQYGFQPWTCKYVLNPSPGGISLAGALVLGLGFFVYLNS